MLGKFGYVHKILHFLFRKNNLEEVTEENFCELATKDSRMGNIIIGVYRSFIGDYCSSLNSFIGDILQFRIKI